MTGMLERFGFVMVDVALKIFFFVFTYQASLLLSRSEFDMLSYFRSTLTMCVGASTSTIGIYFLVYARKMHGSSKYGGLYVGLPVLVFLFLLIMMASVLTIGEDRFKLAPVLDAMGRGPFFMAILIAAMAQLMLIYRKAIGTVAPLAVVGALVGLLAMIAPGAWLLSHERLPGAAFYICLGYSALLAVFIGPHRRAMTSAGHPGPALRRAILAAMVVLKRFLLPNFVETLFSIVAPWLAVYALVNNAGMEGVGPVLFYQALIGLPVFLIYSMTLNDHAVYEAKAQGMRVALARFRHLYIAFFSVVALIGGGFCLELKSTLRLDGLSSTTVFCLFAATLLQSELIVKGMMFKKAGESIRTMRHNALYSVSLCVGAYALTLHMGRDGYAVAVMAAWLLAYLYVNWDFRRVFYIVGQSMWWEIGLIMSGFGVLMSRGYLHWSLLACVIGAFMVAIAIQGRAMKLKR